MSSISCFLWWIALGGLGGVLGSWLIGSLCKRPALQAIERIVEKPVDRFVDNPAHLSRIRALEAEVASAAGLRAQITQLQATPPQIVEKIVEKPVDRIVQDTVGIEQREQKIRLLQQRIDDLEHRGRLDLQTINAQNEELQRLSQFQSAQPVVQAANPQPAAQPAPVRAQQSSLFDVAAAHAAGFKLKNPDDLEVIEGIGPKIAELLQSFGVNTFTQLAQMSPAQIQPMLDSAGPNFRMAKPETWPEQAALASSNNWSELKSLQDKLTAGNR